MAEIEFLFDFASPNAYMAHRTLPGIAERTGATVRYTPCLLGGIFKLTNNQAPMIAFADIHNKLVYEQLEMRRFIERHGLAHFTMNPHFPVITLLIMRGAIVAEEEGLLPAYVEAMMHHMWEEPKKMDDPEIAKAALSQSGFDAERILARTQEPAIKKKLMDNTQQAVDRGAFGIPTFFVGTEIFFGKERMGQVEEQAART